MQWLEELADSPSQDEYFRMIDQKSEGTECHLVQAPGFQLRSVTSIV
jgi:hypothetical protein